MKRSHRNDNERFYRYLKFYSYDDLIIQMKRYLYKSNRLPMQVLDWLTPTIIPIWYYFLSKKGLTSLTKVLIQNDDEPTLKIKICNYDIASATFFKTARYSFIALVCLSTSSSVNPIFFAYSLTNSFSSYKDFYPL